MMLSLLILLYFSSQTTLSATPAPAIQLNWIASKSAGVNYYTVLRSTISGKNYDSQANVKTGTSYTDTKIKAGKTYYYVVEAYCKKCNPQYSAYSNQAQAVVP